MCVCGGGACVCVFVHQPVWAPNGTLKWLTASSCFFSLGAHLSSTSQQAVKLLPTQSVSDVEVVIVKVRLVTEPKLSELWWYYEPTPS